MSATNDRNDETVEESVSGLLGTAVGRLHNRAQDLPRDEYERVLRQAIEALERLTAEVAA